MPDPSVKFRHYFTAAQINSLEQTTPSLLWRGLGFSIFDEVHQVLTIIVENDYLCGGEGASAQPAVRR